MEKQQGVSASLLIVLLCLVRMCHESIGSFHSRVFDLTLSDLMSIDVDELTENLLNNETAAKKYAVMLNALQEYDKAV